MLNLPMISVNPKEKGTLFSICQIRPYLYISSYATVNEKALREAGITHAIDATNIPKTQRLPHVEYLIVPVEDSVSPTFGNLKDHFQHVADFVTKAHKEGGRVLIYCAAGISRSASLCMVTLMILEGITLREAYTEVLAVRPVIAPNVEFWSVGRQMIEFEKKTKGGTATVEMLKGMRTPIPSVYLERSSMLRTRDVAHERETKAT